VIPRSLYIEKVDALRRYVPEHAGSLAELAIRYALQNSGVTTAITSMHVEQFARMNVEAAERGPLPAWVFEELFTMHRFALHLSYFKNFGTHPG
jgi:aryl-alcohol dehydrogenase-like predicted oxidoreductase